MKPRSIGGAFAIVKNAALLPPSQRPAAIGVSVDFFEAHVQPELAVVREGRKVLIPVAELERWVSERANRTLA